MASALARSTGTVGALIRSSQMRALPGATRSIFRGLPAVAGGSRSFKAQPVKSSPAAGRSKVSASADTAATSENASGEEASVPLLTPYQMGPFPLSMRIVYAPLTRCRALGNIPQPSAATYYAQRAHDGQLLITEATVVSPDGFGYPNCPGIFTEEQVEAWKPIVKAVKDKGATFFCQLWHVGRASHPAYMPDGVSLPLGPSPIPVGGDYTIYTPSFEAVKPVVPKEMTKDDIKRIVGAFRQAAANAIRAGFDGIEIHGANGYILDTFLKDGCNKRTDEYGGPIENRARFHLEVVDAIVEEIGAERMGIRLSPYEGYLDSSDSDPLSTNLYMVEQLNKRGITYVHMVEARASTTLEEGSEPPPTKTLQPFRKAFNGTFIAAGGFTREIGNEAIASGAVDLVAYGRLYLANPDLPYRYKINAPLNPYDRSTFYSPEQVKGYTDYPFLEEASLAKAQA